MPCLHNYITVDREAFLANTSRIEQITAMCLEVDITVNSLIKKIYESFCIKLNKTNISYYNYSSSVGLDY